MTTMHRNASHPLRLAPRALGVMAALGLALVGKPVQAADGPSSAAPAPETQAAAVKPGASKRGLDGTARRALRASSSGPQPRPDAAPPSAERVAMREAAPAEPEADPPKRGKSKKKASKGDDNARAPSDEDGRKISLDEDFLVEGKLEKPNAFYILRRSQSGYDWARLDAKFLPLVLESVQDPLF